MWHSGPENLKKSRPKKLVWWNLFWPISIFCNFKNGQKSIFEQGKSLKLPKMQFHENNLWFIWFHDIFCLDFFELLLVLTYGRLIYFPWFPFQCLLVGLSCGTNALERFDQFWGCSVHRFHHRTWTVLAFFWEVSLDLGANLAFPRRWSRVHNRTRVLSVDCNKYKTRRIF